MNDNDKTKFEALLRKAVAVTAMPNGKRLENVLPPLFEGLRPYNFPAVEAAVNQHCRTSKFFPSLSDIVGLIEGDETEQSLKCWTLVTRAIETIGHWHSVRFPHPAIHAAIDDMGGWVWLATHYSYDNAAFLQKSFERHFRSAIRHPETVSRNRNFLPGIDDRIRNGDTERQLEIIDAITGQPVEIPLALSAGKTQKANLARQIAAQMKI